jgi:hypothetical protein
MLQTLTKRPAFPNKFVPCPQIEVPDRPSGKLQGEQLPLFPGTC